MAQNEGFSYSYSAKEQEEIQRIRQRYEKKEASEESDIERLRRLDARVTQKGTVAALVLGILGTLIMGLGMSFAMSPLGAVFTSPSLALAIGIPVGLLGMVGVALAYPLYNRITVRERERIAPEILRLTEKLMK
ncbi:MAG: hypothetical protein IJY71_04065 [Clostridia bacterium]|nr:hypothetical protein [Clostridia bacterium]